MKTGFLFLAACFYALMSTGCAHSQHPVSRPDIEQVITTTGQGTRSEARHGTLRYQGKDLPDVFQWLVDGDTAYHFKTRSYMWGNDGYHPDLREETPPRSEETLSQAEESKGWYVGAKRKKGTPESWVYVEWKGGSAFAHPEHLSAMAEQLDLNIIPRMGQHMMMPRRR